MNETFFSSQFFADAWCTHFGGNQRPFPLVVPAADRQVFGVATVGRTGLRSVSFAPEGFYGSPGWESDLVGETVSELLAQLQSRRIRRFIWNVRFDHGALAGALATALPDVSQHSTQVIALAADYEESFSRFNATVRNQVRKARKSGVAVRVGQGGEDLRAYYAIHQRHVARRVGYDFVYPSEFLLQLIQPEAQGRLLLATVGEKVAAGGIFLRDGNSVYYFHGAYDPEYSKYFPTCAVIDSAIQWAHETEAATFNMGGSAGLESLERFKSFWGAETVPTWRFCWRNPLWNRFDGATEWIRKLAHNA